MSYRIFLGDSVVKDLRAVQDEGSAPVLGRSLGEETGNPLRQPCLGTPWTEESGRLHSVVSQRVGHD